MPGTAAHAENILIMAVRDGTPAHLWTTLSDWLPLISGGKSRCQQLR